MRPEALLDLVASAMQQPAKGCMIFPALSHPRRLSPRPHDIDIRLEDPADGRMIRHAFRIKMLSPVRIRGRYADTRRWLSRSAERNVATTRLGRRPRRVMNS